LTSIGHRWIPHAGLFAHRAFHQTTSAINENHHLQGHRTEIMSENAVSTDLKALLTLTAQIVSAYAAKATLTPAALTDVIGEVSRALGRIGTDAAAAAAEPVELVPAVPIKKSVSADFIVCLEDGKKLKMLKRHLMSTYGLTPADYRTKWNLPRDYPMVAPNYAATRSQLAKKSGLGRAPAPVMIEVPATPEKNAPARRGRPAKKAPADAPAAVIAPSPELAAPAAVKPAARRGRPAKVAAAA
jgi:predicted transcriptional regulator